MADHSQHASDWGSTHGFSGAGLAGDVGAKWSLCWGSFFFFFWYVFMNQCLLVKMIGWMLPVISDGCILTLVCSVFRYIGYLPFDYLAAQTLNTKVFYIFKLRDTGFFVNI